MLVETRRSILDNDVAKVAALMRAHFMAALIGGELAVAESPELGVVGAATWCALSCTSESAFARV